MLVVFRSQGARGSKDLIPNPMWSNEYDFLVTFDRTTLSLERCLLLLLVGLPSSQLMYSVCLLIAATIRPKPYLQPHRFPCRSSNFHATTTITYQHSH